MSLLIFLAVLSVLIIVHEFGHFIVAKKMGVRVERFALGFGPRVFSLKKKETEYCLCLIPLGGYVKLAGDSWNEFKGSPDEYLSRSPREKAGIVFFGPALNYALGFLCFYLVLVLGFPNLTSKVGGLIEGYPASLAGIRVGDEVIAVSSYKVKTWEELQSNIRNKKGQILELVVLRNRQELNFKIIPRQEKVKNLFGQEETVNLVGIKPEEEVVYIKHGALESVGLAWKKEIELTVMTFKAFSRMLTGAMSFKDSVTGPLGIFYITKEATRLGFNSLLHVVAVLSTSLGIFNLLPLPLLDGGHLFLMLVEKIKGTPIGKRADDVITRLGFSLIIFLALFVFYNDLVKFGVLEKIIGWFK